MEYKIFGPAGWPPDGFKDDLTAFLNLDEGQSDAIADWFLTARSYNLWEPHLPSNIAASTLLPEQFRQTAGCIHLLVISWQRYGLKLGDIERDLLLLGCSSEQLAILVSFLQRLSNIKERVWADWRRGLQNVSGLPTIDDVNIICDARPVFGSDAYYYFGADDSEHLHKSLVGFTHLVILEIISSDNYGQKQRNAVQMTEETFQGLLKAMNRAREQLDILKERTTAMGPYS